MRPRKGLLALGFVLMVINRVSGLVLPYSTRYLVDSVITFRARYQRHEDLLAVADLLVLDSANPRAFAGVLRRLRTELGKLPGDGDSLQALLRMLPAEGAGMTLDTLRGADDPAIAKSESKSGLVNYGAFVWKRAA